MVELGIKLVSKVAKMPTKKDDMSVGLDCYSCQKVDIFPNSVVPISLGVSLDIPEGYWGELRIVVDLARKGMLAHAAIIDSGVVGVLECLLFNPTNRTQKIKVGDTICQLILHKIADEAVPTLIEG